MQQLPSPDNNIFYTHYESLLVIWGRTRQKKKKKNAARLYNIVLYDIRTT